MMVNGETYRGSAPGDEAQHWPSSRWPCPFKFTEDRTFFYRQLRSGQAHGDGTLCTAE